MLSYAVKRIVLAVLILVVVMAAMFAMVFLIPGDPGLHRPRAPGHPRAQGPSGGADGPRPALARPALELLPQRRHRGPGP